MVYLVAFILLSIPVVIISSKSFINRKSHGFYRFFSFELILLLLIFKIEYWFDDPFSIHQIISWTLLMISLFMVFTGILNLKKGRKPSPIRDQEDLYAFEKTSYLVKTGIYKYVRHPMYSSLLLLTWGIYLKKPDIIFLFVAVFSSLCLFFTALADEKECIQFFGPHYTEYMKTTKRFIPFIF